MFGQNSWNHALVDLVYPRRCAVCDSLLPYRATGICQAHDKLPYVKEPCCMRCGKEVEEDDTEYCADCANHARSFVRAYPVFNYVEPVKSGVLAMKYHGRREYADYYGTELAGKLRPELSRMRLSGIVPVPVHKHKLKTRGYNQAALLADVVGKCLGIPVYKDLLRRVEDTMPQKELSPEQRANNIRRALTMDDLPPDIKNILLIDDIYTTGATAEACVQTLLAAGVKEVYVGVICIGKGR